MALLSLTFRYTSITENSVQNTPENSLGGYITTNSVYDAASITSSITQVDSIVPVTVLPVETAGLSLIDFEVIKYTSTDVPNFHLDGVTRGLVPNIGTTIGFPHGMKPQAESVRYLTVSNLFDPKFDNNYKQYRCIAIKNISSFAIDDVKVIVINDNDSDPRIDIGIEVPKHDYRTGRITSVSSGSLFINSGFAGLFADNYFANSLLRITSGTATGNLSLISSYDGATGTFVTEDDLGTIAINDNFEIDPAPSQRVLNQLVKPELDGFFFGFLEDGGSDEIAHDSVRENVGNFRPNDVFYLWVQRTIKKNVKSKSDTAAVILIQHLLAGS